jgi:hypothetical protein
MKNLVVICLVLLYAIVQSPYSYSQSVGTKEQVFNLTIQNAVLTSDKTMEFDLYLKSMDAKDPFELALFQACILLDPAFCKGGDIKVSLDAGVSELNENQKPQAVVFSKETNAIKLPSRTLKPAPQNTTTDKARGTIISAKGKGTLLCHIIITNSIAFQKVTKPLSFNFSKQPYPTLVSRYKEGLNTPLICNEKNCFVK